MSNAIEARRKRRAAFAPQTAMPARPNPPLEIASLRDYRLREPVSGRTYTVLRLETRGGLRCRKSRDSDSILRRNR